MNRRTLLKNFALASLGALFAKPTAAAKTKWTQPILVAVSYDDTTLESYNTKVTVDTRKSLLATPLRALQTIKALTLELGFGNRFLTAINGSANQINWNDNDICWFVFTCGQTLDLDQRNKVVLVQTPHTQATKPEYMRRQGIALGSLENLPVLVSDRLAALATTDKAIKSRLNAALKKYRSGAAPQLTVTYGTVARHKQHSVSTDIMLA